MKILIDMGHPAHVHFFRNAIRELERRGHEVKVTARDKDVTLKLLGNYGIKHEVRGRLQPGLLGKAVDMFKVDMRVLEIAKDFKPDLMMGVHNPYIAHVSNLLRVPSIIFTDSEPVPIADFLTFPFTNMVLTPTSYRKDLGKKHKKVNCFKELAYLHPRYFTPSQEIIAKYGLKPSDKFVLLRFVSWQASHDVEQGGFSDKDKLELVRLMKEKARVFISAEGKLPPELQDLCLKIEPHHFHDFLAFSSLLVTDSQTVTTEAACLGTPVVRCNSFVGENDMGNFIELEKRYGLIFSFRESADALKKARELINNPDLKPEWALKRKKLLGEKTDIVKFLVDLIEEWPAKKKRKMQEK